MSLIIDGDRLACVNKLICIYSPQKGQAGNRAPWGGEIGGAGVDRQSDKTTKKKTARSYPDYEQSGWVLQFQICNKEFLCILYTGDQCSWVAG